MKRSITFIIIAVLALALASCGTGQPTILSQSTSTAQVFLPSVPQQGSTAGGETSQPAPSGGENPAPLIPQSSESQVLIQSLDNKMLVLGIDGQSTPFTNADRPFNSPLFNTFPGNRISADTLFGISIGQNGVNQVYTISPSGMQVLDFIQQLNQGLAVFPGDGPQSARLAWDTYSIDPNTGKISSSLWVSESSGANLKEAARETGSDRILVAGRWSKDGKRLYFSKEPVGLGGYILFGGASNLWSYNASNGKTAQLLKEPGTVCIDDLSPDESLVAQHCQGSGIGVTQISSNVTATINPPGDLADAKVSGSARFSPDGQRVAYALARNNPDNEQGWVAVSDGLTGESKLVASSPAGEYFQVAAWLDGQTLILQSWGKTPGVWSVKVDGSSLVRLADGVYHGLINTGG